MQNGSFFMGNKFENGRKLGQPPPECKPGALVSNPDVSAQELKSILGARDVKARVKLGIKGEVVFLIESESPRTEESSIDDAIQA